MSNSNNISKGTAIAGFLLAFVAGVGAMRAIDSRSPASASVEAHADSSRSGSIVAHVNPGAVPVNLYVMSQCPYGVQAENGFKDVAAKFGPDVDLHIDYIGQTGQGGELSSMHGPNEVKGDTIQVCVQKYAPGKAFDFILCQDQNSREIGSNGASCAQQLGLPVDKITACADGPEGKALLAASFKRSEEKGARGSPTIYIGGQKYEGGRRPTDFMKAICAAASGRKPAACSDIPESPKVNVTLLGDARCGADCDTHRYEGMLRARIGAPVIKTVDYSSPEGKQLYAAIKPAHLPAILFDKTLDADKEALQVFSRGMKPAGDYRVLSAGGWDPACSDEGGCKLDECKSTMQCRTEIPKKLDVFVMSHCPFGVKGLDAMKEVVDNFKKAGEKIDFAIHYIGDGDAKSLSSMHGPTEVDEDVRESCVIKHYGKDLKFMDYIWCRDKNIRSDDWQSCTGGTTGIDTDVVKKCAEGDEGKQLVASSFADSKASGIGASPTWLANNKFKFSGIDPETIKTNFCAHNKIAGCDVKLSGQAPAPAGAKQPGCGG